MDTRERIMEAAITLFNEQGTAPVSTNHIARAAGISPGNLYYHFRNKEEIIRAIVAQLIPVWRTAAALPPDRPPRLADLLQIIRANFAVVWRYRFYYRELPALILRDEALGAQYRAMREEGLVGLQVVLQRLTQTGILRVPPEPGVIQELAQISWILADFWLPFVELGGIPPGPEQTRQGEHLIVRLLQPYLTDDALAHLATPADRPAGGKYPDERSGVA
jgi:AcrR family transcriptional regulator